MKAKLTLPQPTIKPSNEQDNNEDDDFERAESLDSDVYEDDGVPRTEEIPSPRRVKTIDREKMEITLERYSNSND